MMTSAASVTPLLMVRLPPELTVVLLSTVAVGPSGRVYSFEPQRALYHVLCGNLALNGLGNVTAVHGALGSRADSIFVPMLDYGKDGNFGGLGLEEKRSAGILGENVSVSTLDALALAQCDFICRMRGGSRQETRRSRCAQPMRPRLGWPAAV
jgi:FkbM family methyltransferase